MSKLDKIEELQNIIKEDSSNFQARRKLAVLLMDSGFNEDPLGHLLYLSKNFSNDDGIFYNLGIVYEKLKKFANAKEAYLKSLEISPDSMDSTYNLGLVYIELKEYDKAIECFEKILKDDNEDSNSYFNLGLIYFKTKTPTSLLNKLIGVITYGSTLIFNFINRSLSQPIRQSFERELQGSFSNSFF